MLKCCRLELDNLASFLKGAVAYKKKIGFKGELLLEPKPQVPPVKNCSPRALSSRCLCTHPLSSACNNKETSIFKPSRPYCWRGRLKASAWPPYRQPSRRSDCSAPWQFA